MKEFFWDYFTRTGTIDAYLHYRDTDEWTGEDEETELGTDLDGEPGTFFD